MVASGCRAFQSYAVRDMFLNAIPRKGEGTTAVSTYRHILSPQAMTVFNPLRVIAHCDIDAAYAQFEQVRLGLPDDVPLICAQWQSIIAVNYPARKYGIKRFNTIDEAKKMCPHLIVQHVATYRNGEAEAGYWGEVDPRTHKVSLDPYRRESLKILAVFKEMVPKGELEKASIDEAFLDLSPMVIDRILERHPHLRDLPDDAPDGLDSPLPPAPPIDWTKAGNVFPIGGEGAADEDEAKSDGGSAVGGTDEAREQAEASRWEDWALCMGAEIMAELRNEVWKRLHYTCSAGIAHNKAMAKLCSAWKKPNNQTVLRTAAVPAFLRNMPFTEIRFLGGKLGNAIATEYNASTVGDMLTVSLEEMQSRFGEESIWVYNILRGIDHSEVTPRVATKSMLASKNTRPPVTTPEQGMHWINVLAGELNVRLRESREIAPGLWPKTLVLGNRTGIEAPRHRQVPFPFTRNLSTEYIVKYAKKLWDEFCQPYRNGVPMKLNNMSLTFNGLEKLEEGQRGIENFFGAKPAQAEASTTSRLPSKRSRSSSPQEAETEVKAQKTASAQGTPPVSGAKTRLPTLHTGKRKTALDTFLLKAGESSRQSSIFNLDERGEPDSVETNGPVSESNEHSDDIVAIEPEPSSSNGSRRWQCPKCNALFAEPDATGRSLTAQQLEHEDYHYAMTLMEQDPSFRPSGRLAGKQAHQRTPQISNKGKKQEMTRKEGIKAFFAPKSPKKPKH